MSEKTRSSGGAGKSIVKTSDPTLHDLQERYYMDEDVWHKSKRGFPFNIPMQVVVAISLGLPLSMSLVYFDYANTYLWKVYLFTLLISTAAYFVTDKAIEQFKESLEKNGLFGKDLNKAGERDKKPPV